MPQRTLKTTVCWDGIGVHTGQPARLELRPALADHGLRVVRADLSDTSPVPVHVRTVVDSRLATVIGGEGWRLMTVEHLLAALMAADIDNVEIAVFGPEVPVLDGSAAPFVRGLEETGFIAQDRPRRVLTLLRPVAVEDGPRRGRLLPAKRLELAASIDFPHPAIGAQSLAVAASDFGAEIAWARTFGFLHEVEAMRAAGLGLGGSLENAVVFGPEGALNPGGLRAPDEPVRHKILDMMGDLALVGAPLRARYEAERPGHALSAKLITKLLAEPDAWEWVED